jgi:hypothetical protein
MQWHYIYYLTFVRLSQKVPASVFIEIGTATVHKVEALHFSRTSLCAVPFVHMPLENNVFNLLANHKRYLHTFAVWPIVVDVCLNVTVKLKIHHIPHNASSERAAFHAVA